LWRLRRASLRNQLTEYTEVNGLALEAAQYRNYVADVAAPVLDLCGKRKRHWRELSDYRARWADLDLF
jgi:hypothetical protein